MDIVCISTLLESPVKCGFLDYLKLLSAGLANEQKCGGKDTFPGISADFKFGAEHSELQNEVVPY